MRPRLLQLAAICERRQSTRIAPETSQSRYDATMDPVPSSPLINTPTPLSATAADETGLALRLYYSRINH